MAVIYYYTYMDGGFADMVKFLSCISKLSYDSGRKLQIIIDHPINQFIIIKSEYQCNCDIINYTNLDTLISSHMTILEIVKDYHNLIIHPRDLYKNQNAINNIDFMDYISDYKLHTKNFPIYNYISYTNHIYDELKEIQPKMDYIAIHIRYGDKFLEIPRKGRTDDRSAIKDNIYKAIDQIINDNDTKIFLLCDNNLFKKSIIKDFPTLNFIDKPSINISYNYNKVYSKNQYNDCLKHVIVEFLLLQNSKKIHSLTYSGFPIIASILNDSCQLITYY